MVLETFQGFVDLIRDGIGYVTLTPETGDKLIAEIPVTELEKYGIKERRRFILRTIDIAGEVSIELEAIPDRIITAEEERDIDIKVRKALGYESCSHCDNSGWVGYSKCHVCNGTGYFCPEGFLGEDNSDQTYP
jgi:hypothetical protein